MEDKNVDTNKTEAKGLKKVLFMFLGFLRNCFYDFFTSFRYNHMKFPAILVASPGLFIGFFLSYHAKSISSLVIKSLPDLSGMFLFLLMLFGILNIFSAVSLNGKKNLGSVITATIFTTLLTISAVMYITIIAVSYSDVSSGVISGATAWKWDINKIMSIGAVILSVVLSITGIVLSFIFYDRTYEKVIR